MLMGTAGGSKLEISYKLRIGSQCVVGYSDTKSNSIAAIGRFTDPYHDSFIIRSPWGIGIMNASRVATEVVNKYELKTSALAPNGRRFGGWLYKLRI